LTYFPPLFQAKIVVQNLTIKLQFLKQQKRQENPENKKPVEIKNPNLAQIPL